MTKLRCSKQSVPVFLDYPVYFDHSDWPWRARDYSSGAQNYKQGPLLSLVPPTLFLHFNHCMQATWNMSAQLPNRQNVTQKNILCEERNRSATLRPVADSKERGRWGGPPPNDSEFFSRSHLLPNKSHIVHYVHLRWMTKGLKRCLPPSFRNFWIRRHRCWAITQTRIAALSTQSPPGLPLPRRERIPHANFRRRNRGDKWNFAANRLSWHGKSHRGNPTTSVRPKLGCSHQNVGNVIAINNRSGVNKHSPKYDKSCGSSPSDFSASSKTLPPTTLESPHPTIQAFPKK